MTRTTLLGFKTYGRADRKKTKYTQCEAGEKNVRVPLMSWNELVNKSDSFDKLTRTSEVYKEVCNVSAGYDRNSVENGRKKQRKGLSLRRKWTKKKASADVQSMGLKKSPTAALSNPTIHRCKPYPPCSPIEVPMDSNEVLKMSHDCKTIYDNFIKVKEPDRKKIVQALQKVLKAKEPPGTGMPRSDHCFTKTETDSHLAFPAYQCLSSTSMIFRNFEAHMGFRATSTPSEQSTVSALKFPSSHSDRELSIRLPPSNVTKELQPVHHSPNLGNQFTKLQPHAHLVRLRTRKRKDVCGTYHIPDESHELLDAKIKQVVANVARTKILSCGVSSEMTPPTLGKQYEVNRATVMGSTQSTTSEHDHQAIKHESEATTVSIEIPLSLTGSHLKSSLGQNNTPLQQSLLLLCRQPEILDFETCFPKRQIKKCSKVGEGSYGEVFAVTVNTELLILKVVPFKEDLEVSDATQQKFQDIQNEAVVSRELSNLRIDDRCSTYIRLIKTYCIKGKYPNMLLRAWQQYHRDIGSENENPKVFNADQLFMIFVYENGGCDLEKYKFAYAAQVKSAFLQICCALAVAEEAFKFEHRDLHWGNVLVSKTDCPMINFKLSKNRLIKISSEGISVRIIDYSICRMQKGKDQIICTDLSNEDSLFNGQGDYQFEIYRMMKALNNNNWQEYNPKTNIYWLDYILEKLLSKAKCSRGNKEERKRAINLLQRVKELLPTYSSSLKFVDSCRNKWETDEI